MPVSRVAELPTWMLSRANARAQGILYDAFAQAGLRPVHYRTMAALDEHGDLSQAELGRHLGLDRKDVAVTVDFLSGRDLVSRSPDPTDARRKIVTLTKAGRVLLPQLDRTLAEVQRQVLAPLSAREAKDLLRLLAKLGPATPH
jgi:DNA-binding MarR family transcriptional regulator